MRNTGLFGPKVFKDDEIETEKKELFAKVKNRNYLKLEELLEDERYRNLAKTAIDEEDNEKSALHFAVESERLDTVRLLLDIGADSRVQDSKGKTPIYYAAADGNNEMLKLFIKKLPRKGLKKDKKALDLQEEGGKTPLYAAAAKGDLPGTKTLKKKANIDLASKIGKTPLYISIENSKAGTAEVLIKAGAELDKKYGEKTPLLLAIEKNLEYVAQLLIKAGANLAASDRHRQTPLYLAIKHKQRSVVRALLAKNASLDQADKNGVTPVELANAEDYKNEAIKTMINEKSKRSAERSKHSLFGR